MRFAVDSMRDEAVGVVLAWEVSENLVWCGVGGRVKRSEGSFSRPMLRRARRRE